MTNLIFSNCVPKLPQTVLKTLHYTLILIMALTILFHNNPETNKIKNKELTQTFKTS